MKGKSCLMKSGGELLGFINRLVMKTIKIITRIIAGAIGVGGLYLIFGIVIDTYVLRPNARL